MEKGDPTPCTSSLLPLSSPWLLHRFCHYLDALWPFLSWKTACTSRSREALPDCRSSPLPPGWPSTLHMAPMTLRQLRVSYCPTSSSKERAQKAPGLSPTRRRCLVLAGYMSAWKVLSGVKSLLALWGPFRTCPSAWHTEVLSKQSCIKIDSRSSCHLNCIFLQVTRPAFQCSLVPETPTYLLSSCGTFVPPGPLVLCWHGWSPPRVGYPMWGRKPWYFSETRGQGTLLPVSQWWSSGAGGEASLCTESTPQLSWPL